MEGTGTRRRLVSETDETSGESENLNSRMFSRKTTRFQTLTLGIIFIIVLAYGGYVLKKSFSGGMFESTYSDGDGKRPKAEALRIKKLCEVDSSLEVCNPVDIVAELKGDVGMRMYTLCLVEAISSLIVAKRRYIWEANEDISYATFEDLFERTKFKVRENKKEYEAPSTFIDFEVKSSRCSERGEGGSDYEEEREREGVGEEEVLGGPWSSKKRLPGVNLSVTPGLIKWPGWKKPPACSLQRKVRLCYRELRPSESVALLMDKEKFRRVRDSIAVYTQVKSKMPTARKCFGCPDFDFLNCTLRKITMKILRNPEINFTIGGDSPSDAIEISEVFEPKISPLVLFSTADRKSFCPDPFKNSFVKKLPSEGEKKEVLQNSFRRVRRRRDENMGLVNSLRLSRRNTINKFRADKNLRKGKFRRGLLEEEISRKGENIIVEQSIKCLQYQVAEIFSLSNARGLIYSFDSPITKFLAARIQYRLGEHTVLKKEKEICLNDEILPITKQRFASQFFVDEDRKTIYCSIPKVACTSFKIYLRQIKNLSNPYDSWVVHDPSKSGLKELWWHYSERAAIKIITCPDFFKFTFVRNPFSRAVSVFLDKHVNGGPPYTRQHWNRKFFGQLGFRASRFSKNPGGLLSFGQFVDLVGGVMRRERETIEPHIAPQMDMCALNEIKYDFVGRFENLEEDAKKVMGIIGVEKLSAFSIGKKDHPTNASSRLTTFYDEDVFRSVKCTYSMDFEIPFNNISFRPPEILLEKYGLENWESKCLTIMDD